MGRKGNRGPAASSGQQMSLRGESGGKKQGSINAKTMCKLEHIRNIAAWAATEASIPPLAAFFGQRLAATTEALGLRADPSLFLCQRCESILQPGHNCTIRVEKNKSRTRHRRKKSTSVVQNNVVYKCHFCSHRNLLRGTPKGHVKQICPSEARPSLKSDPAKSIAEKKSNLPKLSSIPEFNRMDIVSPPIESRQTLATSSPATPSLSLLDSKRRKRNRSSAKKAVETENSNAADAEKATNASSKRRKSWTSLKEIAQNSNSSSGKKFPNLTIPFII